LGKLEKMEKRPAAEVVHRALAIINVSVYPAHPLPGAPQLVRARGVAAKRACSCQIHPGPTYAEAEEHCSVAHHTGTATATAPTLYQNWQRKLGHIFSNLEIWSASELRARIEEAEEEIAMRLNTLREAGELDRREVAALRRGIDQLRQLRMARRMQS
jgi:hypothetical protein